MIDHLSMIFALIGRCSQIWMPGTLVEIGLNSPRYSDGALGFMSQVSIWLGPPRIHRMITDFCRDGDWPLAAAAASRLSNSGNASPAIPSTPAFTNPRRLNASVRRKSSHPIGTRELLFITRLLELPQ